MSLEINGRKRKGSEEGLIIGVAMIQGWLKSLNLSVLIHGEVEGVFLCVCVGGGLLHG